MPREALIHALYAFKLKYQEALVSFHFDYRRSASMYRRNNAYRRALIIL